jgi:plastocyanin
MRHWKLIVGGIVVLVLVLGAAAAFAATNSLGESAKGDVRPGPGAPTAMRVAMRDNAFDPTSIEVTAGSPVEIELHDEGQANHNFTSQDLDVSSGPVKAGEVTTVTLTVPLGTTHFVCTWHPGMAIDVVGT